LFVGVNRLAKRVKLLQITAPISPGSSGSPVLDASGKVIGIATAVLRDGQSLNFAIPGEVATMMLHAKEQQQQPALIPFQQLANLHAPWIPKGERSSLLMHTATTEKRFIVTADEKLRAFLEPQRVTRESFRFPNAE
jgi:Trypsin-like peptidase domain